MQGRANSKGTPSAFSWAALSKMSQNITGTAIDYEAFKLEYDSNPAYQEVVKKFDANGVTLNTIKDEPTQQASSGGSSLDSMAKRAAQKVVNR